MFGQMKYAESMPLMHRFIRKNALIRYRVRASAVWAAGLIYEGDLHGDPKLEKALLERLNDDAPMPPEDNLVKRMACISLTRMGSNGEETINAPIITNASDGSHSPKTFKKPKTLAGLII